MKPRYLTTREVAIDCRIEHKDGTPDINETLRFLARYQIATVKRGRTVLVDRASLEAHLNRKNVPHGRHSAAASSREQGTVGAPQQEAR